jgi:hypothetical protein
LRVVGRRLCEWPPQFGDASPHRGLWHASEVEGRRVKCRQHVGLQLSERVRVVLSERVRVVVAHVPDRQVPPHPLAKGFLIDGRGRIAGGEDGAEGAAEGGELVPSAEVHAGDAWPQGVRRSLAAGPASRSGETGVDEAWRDRQPEATLQVVGSLSVHPPAVGGLGRLDCHRCRSSRLAVWPRGVTGRARRRACRVMGVVPGQSGSHAEPAEGVEDRRALRPKRVGHRSEVGLAGVDLHALRGERAGEQVESFGDPCAPGTAIRGRGVGKVALERGEPLVRSHQAMFG